MNRALVIWFVSTVFVLQTETHNLRVRHDHDPWGECRGELSISARGIEYRPDHKKKHQRVWDWEDIQTFDRKSPQRFSVLTYEDLAWKLGKDRFFDFTVVPGGDALSEEAFDLVARRLGKPVTDRLIRDVAHEYEVPAKHLHTFGGCQGVLRAGPDWIVFEARDHPRHSRSWKRGRDIESVWSADPYHLEVHAFENNQRGFETTRRFRFHLKQRLDADYYQKLRREMVPDW